MTIALETKETKQPSHVTVATASLIGTAIEWYDFFLYGTAAALIFNKLFFPTFDPMVGTLLAFGTYALSFQEIAGQLIPTAFGQALFGSGLMWVIIFAPLALVFLLSFRIQKMSVGAAQATFLIYAALVGVSLSTIFVAYATESIARVFFVTAATFGATSLWGYTTKRDLTGMGSFLFMGLVGVVIASIDTYLKYAEAVGITSTVSRPAVSAGEGYTGGTGSNTPASNVGRS